MAARLVISSDLPSYVNSCILDAGERWLTNSALYELLKFLNSASSELRGSDKAPWLPAGKPICSQILFVKGKKILRAAKYPLPAGGSLFLINKKMCSRYRKDGLEWEKKKDGKSLLEHHEKLLGGWLTALCECTSGSPIWAAWLWCPLEAPNT
jgi:hypothetical protein